MAKTTCPHCSAANPKAEMFCQTCGGRLGSFDGGWLAPAAPLAPATSTLGGAVALDYRSAQGRREARAAANALGVGALMSVIRATLLPLLLSAAPPEKFAALVSADVRTANYLLAAAFVGLFFWARREPLIPSIVAVLIYLAWAIPDLLASPVLLGGGHLGKVVMLGVLGRAVSAGVMHRLLRYERAA